MLRPILAIVLLLVVSSTVVAQVNAIRKAKENIERRATYTSNLGDVVTMQVIGKVEQRVTINLSDTGGKLHVDYKLYRYRVLQEHVSYSVALQDLDRQVDSEKSMVTLHSVQKDKVTCSQNLAGVKNLYQTDTLVIRAGSTSGARELAESIRILITAER